MRGKFVIDRHYFSQLANPFAGIFTDCGAADKGSQASGGMKN
jgi:hypothetical protein